MKVVTKFTPDSDRYHYDFEQCTAAKGWAQFDTDQDAWYFGHWINPESLELLEYAEGDVTHFQAESESEFIAKVKHWLEAYSGAGIDHMCSVRIIAPLVRMGLLPAKVLAKYQTKTPPALPRQQGAE